MRILILNQSFFPDVVAVAQHASDLAAGLAAEGHSVTVVASRQAYTDTGIQFPARETWRGCTVRRVPAAGLGKGERWRRILDSAVLLASFLGELIRLPRFDVVIAMTHPPMVGFLAALAKRVKGGRLISWVMDLNPDEAIAAGWIPDDSWTARLLKRVLRSTLRSSDRVVVMDRFMQQRIEEKGIPRRKLTVIPPWSHDDAVRYDEAGRAEFRQAHGLAGKFVVMYSGNMSPVHPLDTLLRAAEQLRERQDIAFCFVGGGGALPTVRDFAANHGLGNILCLPYQKLEQLGASLSAADLHVVVMGDEMVGIVHPCKIYNILALGIPFLHVGPERNHIVDLIDGLKTLGGAYDVGHRDVAGVVGAILAAAKRRRGPVPELITAAALFAQTSLVPKMIRVVLDRSEGAPPVVDPWRDAAGSLQEEAGSADSVVVTGNRIS